MNIYFNITSPTPGTFMIALHFKGRDKPILEMDLKIDDLLEKQKDHQAMLDLEYVQLNVPKVLALFNKVSLFIYPVILVMGLTVGCSCSRRGDKGEKPPRDECDRRTRSVHIISLRIYNKGIFSPSFSHSGPNYSARWYLHIYCLVPVAHLLSITFIILDLFSCLGWMIYSFVS